MNASLAPKIERAQELLKTALHIAMATVNDDGSPHNTPLFFIHDQALEYIYWSSHPDSLHCRNALRTGQVFFALYESNAGGGLFIKANEAIELSGEALTKGIAAHNALRAKEGKAPLPRSFFSGDSPQRMYRASPTNFYVNYSQKDNEGDVLMDTRCEISLEELTGAS